MQYILIIFLAFIILLLARKNILMTIGSFLIIQNKLEKADVIVVLAGDSERIKEAVSLYEEGFGNVLLMSGGKGSLDVISSAENMKNEAVSLGVSAKNILIEPMSKHTYEHPVFIKPILEKNNYQSAIIVSSPYHMRRVKILFYSVFKKSDIKLIYHPVRNAWFNPHNWWQNQNSRSAVASEYMKLSVNMFGSKISGWVYGIFQYRRD